MIQLKSNYSILYQSILIYGGQNGGRYLEQTLVKVSYLEQTFFLFSEMLVAGFELSNIIVHKFTIDFCYTHYSYNLHEILF